MSAKHKKYYSALSDDDRMLITLRDELYEGSWKVMQADLDDRLKGKPYIFKLVNRIKDDIHRIEKLAKYEVEHGVNLADFKEGSSTSP